MFRSKIHYFCRIKYLKTIYHEESVYLNGLRIKESMEVVLNIKRKVKPECVSALKESFLKCKESTLLEPGCIDYGMYQSLTDSTEFFIAETWKNDGELQKHGETAHLKQHLNEIKDMGDPSYKGSFRKIYVCPSVND